MILSFFLLGIEELGIQLEEPFRFVSYFYYIVFPRHYAFFSPRSFVHSLLPQHKITNGIGLSAEEHVEWMLKDDSSNREGRVNSINAALGPAKQMVNGIQYLN